VTNPTISCCLDHLATASMVASIDETFPTGRRGSHKQGAANEGFRTAYYTRLASNSDPGAGSEKTASRGRCKYSVIRGNRDCQAGRMPTCFCNVVRLVAEQACQTLRQTETDLQTDRQLPFF
jgi:hypothetical protein